MFFPSACGPEGREGNMDQWTTADPIVGAGIPAAPPGLAGGVMINVSGEPEDGRAFFGTGAVRVFHAP